MELDNRLIEALRARYQSDMKCSVSRMSDLLKDVNNSAKRIDEIDKELGYFMLSKEKATHFEAIIKNLKGEENEKI